MFWMLQAPSFPKSLLRLQANHKPAGITVQLQLSLLTVTPGFNFNPSQGFSFKSPISKFSPTACTFSNPSTQLLTPPHLLPSLHRDTGNKWGAVLQEGQCLRDTVLIRRRQCCYFLYNLAYVCLSPECQEIASFSICGQREQGFILLLCIFNEWMWCLLNCCHIIWSCLHFDSEVVSEVLISRKAHRRAASHICERGEQDRSPQYYNFLFELIISCECHSGHKHSIYLHCGSDLNTCHHRFSSGETTRGKT